MKIKFEEKIPVSNMVKATIMIGLAQLLVFVVTCATIIGMLVIIIKFIGS